MSKRPVTKKNPLPEPPRVLSLKQPWAWTVATGKKRVENRTWSTKYRGPIYIHASSKFAREGANWLACTMRLSPPDDVAQSAVVAVADLTAVVTSREAARFGKWFFG